MNQKQGWIGDPVVKDIRTTKAESETRLSKLRQKYPELLGYGITRGSGEHISVLVEKTTPEIESLFRKGIRGQPVKFIEVGHVVALTDRTAEFRPLIGGISVGHEKITAGTIGSIVYDQDTNQPLILSNCHVLANSDTPDEERALSGDPILQPGVYDSGTEIVATLYDWIPIHNEVTVDAAVALPITDVSNYILDIPCITGTTCPKIGTKIKKSGRTTGLTEGEIISVESTLEVDYGFENIRLTDQFVTTYMSDPGDSGSLGITDDNKVVGLLFAGSSKATVYNDITNVCELLNIKFIPYGKESTNGDETVTDEIVFTEQDMITIGIGLIGLYLTWRSGTNLNKVLKELETRIPPVPSI